MLRKAHCLDCLVDQHQRLLQDLHVLRHRHEGLNDFRKEGWRLSDALVPAFQKRKQKITTKALLGCNDM